MHVFSIVYLNVTKELFRIWITIAKRPSKNRKCDFLKYVQNCLKFVLDWTFLKEHGFLNVTDNYGSL